MIVVCLLACLGEIDGGRGALTVDDEEIAEDTQLVAPTSCAGAVGSPRSRPLAERLAFRSAVVERGK